MKRNKFLMFVLSILILIASFDFLVYARSYMGDKTEIPVDLEVSGAEALCQTEDGYVWIAQYSGLTRYDSKEFVTYKSFTYEGQEYSIINVRALATSNNVLYIATSERIFLYKNGEFEPLNIETGIINDIILDDNNNMLFISTEKNGCVIYDLNTKKQTTIQDTVGLQVNDVALSKYGSNCYYHLDDGVYDLYGNTIWLNSRILDIYSYDNILYMGTDEGLIRRYNMEKEEFLDDIVVSDQINKMLYSEDEKVLFVACEKVGIYCIELDSDNPYITLADTLENKSQLVDLMIDYEGNLWVASHFIGSSGVSIIAQNELVELLYDDPTWQKLEMPPAFDRNVYAVEKFEDILYIVSTSGIYMYDLKQDIILSDNIIMDTITEYANKKTEDGRKNGDEKYTFAYSPKDVEVFNGKVYFAVSGIGLIEYDVKNESLVIYDIEYITNNVEKTVDNPDLSLTNSMRSLRGFDDYLAIGYSRGIMKFNGEKFSIMNIGSNVLYINKSKDGKLLFDRTKGIYAIDDEFTTVTEIMTNNEVGGNRLKFLVDGDYIYYNLNSRLFKIDTNEENAVSKEITIPYIKGSIVELAKVEYKNAQGESEYKYVIGSQTQVYITNSLDVDTLVDYEFYDATNGLQPIIANTSGYYNEEEQKYYLQSTNGIYVYDFNQTVDVSTPVKVAISSIDLDGEHYYGDTINVDKNVYRVAFNISVLGFKPNKGRTIYYKLDGIDDDYNVHSDDNNSIYYTNLGGGVYVFHAYAIDEYGQKSNEIVVSITKDKKFFEEIWFWITIGIILIVLVVGFNFILVRIRTKKSYKRQLEYKNITLEAIQAIARTIDAKDEYTNGHSIRVGYYSKQIAEHLGMSQEEVDNTYYIALLHDIGKIAIPDVILNKPGKLTDEEFEIMKSHTTRGANILKGISTIPRIVEGAKYHHERYDGKGYPEGLAGENIPYVARIICCADCFDAMASKRVYKDPFPLEKIISEFERCSGTQFDPNMAKLVIKLIKDGILKPYTAENTYLGSDGKTHRIQKGNETI